MRTDLYCFPCFLRQALDATKMVTQNEAIQRKVLSSVFSILLNVSIHMTPVEIAHLVHLRVKSITGYFDPYKEVKKKQNELALRYESILSAQIAEMSDPLNVAMMLSAAGNAIDLAPECTIPDLYKKYMEIISKGFAWDDYELFLKKLARSKTLLYLGDNAGEIVWDKILIEELLENFNLDIIYAVRGFPILNDVTMEDAHFVGMDKVVNVISNGFDAPGTLLNRCSEEFLKKYQESDFILSKGQGNYESLSEENHPIFFLLNVKCPVIAKDIHCDTGDIILKFQSNSKREMN
ncbi:MAG: damage-control phosphatase ARMT1 family protein [Thermodesulfobacteriota bacterium]